MTVGFVFPGQGSQEVGMLRDFLDREAVVRDCFAEAEAAIGVALRKIVLEGPEEELGRTEITQPALLTASVALWRCWNRARRGNIRQRDGGAQSRRIFRVGCGRRDRLCRRGSPRADARSADAGSGSSR